MRVLIQAIEERRPMVEYQCHHLPHAEVIWDHNHDGGWANFLRVMEAAGDDPVLVLEDDATLTVNFEAQAREWIDLGHGNIPIQFFSLTGDPDHSHLRPGQTFIMNQAVYYPAAHANGIRCFAPVWQISGRKGWANMGRKHYDLAIGDFWKQHGVKYLQVVPSLVQHSPGKSALGHPSGRLSPTFVDPELEAHPAPELFA